MTRSGPPQRQSTAVALVAELFAEAERQGFTREELASATDRGVTTLAEWRRGDVSPSLDGLIAFATALGKEIVLI